MWSVNIAFTTILGYLCTHIHKHLLSYQVSVENMDMSLTFVILSFIPVKTGTGEQSGHFLPQVRAFISYSWEDSGIEPSSITLSWLLGAQPMTDVWETPSPPLPALCLYICLSLRAASPSFPQSLPLWCYLWVCVSVGRRWRSVWLNPDKEANSSANSRDRGELVVEG